MLLLLGNIVQPIIVLKTIIGLFHVFNFLYKIEPSGQSYKALYDRNLRL